MTAAALLLSAAPQPSGATELRGHGGPVRAIAVTADGGGAITGSFDTSAIVWALETGAATRVVRFHAGQVNAVAVLPDGGFATAGEDARIALWDKAGTAPVRVLEGHDGPIAALAVSPDGELIASASWDRTVRVWPLADGEARRLERHRDNVNAVAFLADGTLVSGGYDARIVFWPNATDAAPAETALPSPINTLVALPGGRVAAGTADGRVRIVDRSGGVLAEAAVAPTPVIALAASPGGQLIAAAGLKGAVAVLEATTLGRVHDLVGPGLPVWSLAFSQGGSTLLSGGSDRLVRRWDMKTGAHLGSLVDAPADPLAAYPGERGAEVFRACVACHTLSPDAGNRAGPTLAGIFGRRIATLPGYNFSPALKELEIVWTPETVAKLFEVGPAAYTPGTKMPEQRINSAADRAALVDFLERATGSE